MYQIFLNCELFIDLLSGFTGIEKVVYACFFTNFYTWYFLIKDLFDLKNKLQKKLFHFVLQLGSLSCFCHSVGSACNHKKTCLMEAAKNYPSSRTS